MIGITTRNDDPKEEARQVDNIGSQIALSLWVKDMSKSVILFPSCLHSLIRFPGFLSEGN